MKTLRNELIDTIKETLVDELGGLLDPKEYEDNFLVATQSVADAILQLRAFSRLQTDEEQPEYSVGKEAEDAPAVGSEEWKVLKRTELEKANPELALFGGGFPQKDAMGASVSRLEALQAFERDMRFNPLPWDSERDWQKFSKFVVAEYQKDKLIFTKYKTWQENEGKYQALSNRKIRQKPQEFVDCFPDFLAHSAMYGKRVVEEARAENVGLVFDEDGRLVSY